MIRDIRLNEVGNDDDQSAERASFLARTLASRVVTGATTGAAAPPAPDANASAAAIVNEDGPTILLPRDPPSQAPASQGGASAPPSDFYVPKTQVISNDLKESVLAAVDARQRAAPPAARPVPPPPRDLRSLARVLVALGAIIFAIGVAMFVTMD